jgi:hypothetical protein
LPIGSSYLYQEVAKITNNHKTHDYLSEKRKKIENIFLTFFTFLPIWSSYLYPEVAKHTWTIYFTFIYVFLSLKAKKSKIIFFHLFTNLVILPGPGSGQNHTWQSISRVLMVINHKKPKNRKIFFSTFFTFLPIWSSYLYPEVAETTLNRLFHVYLCFSIIKSHKSKKNFFHYFHLFANLVILPVPGSSQNHTKPFISRLFMFFYY